MHIADGVVSMPVLIGGTAAAAAGVAIGLRRLQTEQIPLVAVLSSALFVGSLIHVPIPPVSTHLVLNGLAGILLGWAAFPAILVALLLQAVLFGHGGLTALGVNTLNLAAPAIVCHYLFRLVLVRTAPRDVAHRRGVVLAAGFALGAGAILMSVALVSTALLASGREFLVMVKIMVLAHIPVMLLEGAVTASVVLLIAQVRPGMLTGQAVPAALETMHV